MGLFTSDKVNKALKKIGINLNFVTNSEPVETEYISTIQTCTRILVENVSRLPVIVRNKKGQIVENHIISQLFNRRFTSYISSDTGRKLVERDRVTNGNGFIRIIYDTRGKIEALLPYPYTCIAGIALSGNSMYYSVDNSQNPYVI